MLIPVLKPRPTRKMSTRTTPGGTCHCPGRYPSVKFTRLLATAQSQFYYDLSILYLLPRPARSRRIHELVQRRNSLMRCSVSTVTSFADRPRTPGCFRGSSLLYSQGSSFQDKPNTSHPSKLSKQIRQSNNSYSFTSGISFLHLTPAL